MKIVKVLSYIVFSSLLLNAQTSDSNSSCNRGELSSQFCDRDGDMMADTPTDKKRWLDPYRLLIGTVPSQSFMFEQGSKEALKRHIEKITGKRVEFFPYKTNSAELEAMRSGMLHIAGMNTGSVPTAVNCAGFHLFAMTSNTKIYGYTMQIITYPNSGIDSIEDVKGNTILFTSSSSNSGHKAPVAILKGKFNLTEGKDYKSKFSGSHIKSVEKVANQEFKVASVASGFAKILLKHKKIPKDSIKIIYNSERFPTTGYGYSNRLKPSLAKKIEEAFLTFEWKDGNKTKAFNKFKETQFIKADYNKNWKIIRDIDEANGITYQCR